MILLYLKSCKLLSFLYHSSLGMTTGPLPEQPCIRKMHKSQRHGILFSAVDGRFPIHGEVMPMTTYEKVALVLASLQLLAAILALLK